MYCQVKSIALRYYPVREGSSPHAKHKNGREDKLNTGDSLSWQFCLRQTNRSIAPLHSGNPHSLAHLFDQGFGWRHEGASKSSSYHGRLKRVYGSDEPCVRFCPYHNFFHLCDSTRLKKNILQKFLCEEKQPYSQIYCSPENLPTNRIKLRVAFVCKRSLCGQ